MSVKTVDHIAEVRRRLLRGELPPCKCQGATKDQVLARQAFQLRALEAQAGGPPLGVEAAEIVEALAAAWEASATGPRGSLSLRYPRIAAALLRGNTPSALDVWGPLGPVLGEG